MKFEDLEVWQRAKQLSANIYIESKGVGTNWLKETNEISAMLSGLIKPVANSLQDNSIFYPESCLLSPVS